MEPQSTTTAASSASLFSRFRNGYIRRVSTQPPEHGTQFHQNHHRHGRTTHIRIERPWLVCGWIYSCLSSSVSSALWLFSQTSLCQTNHLVGNASGQVYYIVRGCRLLGENEARTRQHCHREGDPTLVRIGFFFFLSRPGGLCCRCTMDPVPFETHKSAGSSVW